MFLIIYFYLDRQWSLTTKWERIIIASQWYDMIWYDMIWYDILDN